ncbi:MAG: ABC transporter transmembrane domain-containing protein, partial [Proteobacteria bacterium]|nr:ABC transporter transmembrane domain-containing protein [Pseudomonadota bacterium]
MSAKLELLLPTGARNMQLPQALSDALQLCRESLRACFIFSLFANLLNLVPAFYMLNVYDKAVSSGSVYTLGSLTIFAAAMFIMLFVMETLRGQLLVAISARIDGVVGPELYQRTFINAVNVGGNRASVQPLQDFLGVRQFITGNGIFALFDAPWLPIYLYVMYLFHPIIGLVGLISASLLLAIGVVNQKKTAPAMTMANTYSAQSSAATHRTLRNAEVVESMGMLPHLQRDWIANQEQVLTYQTDASNSSVVFTALTKTIRLATQSAAIAVGAYLVIKQEISPGMLIAGSLLVGRALQPVEIALGSWKGFVDARTYYDRLCDVLEKIKLPEERMPLPPLTGDVSVVNAVLVPPGTSQPTVAYASFELKEGECGCILGPSGAGKSSLVRGLLG